MNLGKLSAEPGGDMLKSCRASDQVELISGQSEKYFDCRKATIYVMICHLCNEFQRLKLNVNIATNIYNSLIASGNPNNGENST